MLATSRPSSRTPSKAQKPAADLLRMRDLMRLTGMPRSTIQFYSREGLIPGAVRHGQTSMLYPPTAVERIQLIKRLQKEERLTIVEIRRILSLVDQGGEADASLRLMRTMGPLHGQVAVCNRKQLRASSGLSEKTLHDAIDAGLIIPTTRDEFDPEDVTMASFINRFLSLSGNLADLSFYRQFGQQIVRAEIQLRDRLIQNLAVTDAINVTQEVTLMAKHLRAYLLQRMLYENAILRRDPMPMASPKTSKTGVSK